MGHSSKDKFLDPVQALYFHSSMTYIENQAWQRYFDGTDGFAGITTDTEALRTCSGLDAMQEWGDDQSNSPAVDIAEGVAAYLLIRRADVGAGGTTNAAQRIFETGISAHLAAAIIDEDDVHLFAGRRGSGDKRRIARDLLGGGAAREQAQLRHSFGKGADQLIIAGH